MNKPNCFNCKWQRNIPGDAHIQCVHPKISESDRLLSPLLMMMGKTSPAEKRLNVSGDEYGIKSGWFAWPLNFDPTWLITCDGFESNEKNGGESEKI